MNLKKKRVGGWERGETILIFSHSSETLFYRKLLGGSSIPGWYLCKVSVLCCRELHFYSYRNCFLLVRLRTQRKPLWLRYQWISLAVVEKISGQIWYASCSSASLPRAPTNPAFSGRGDTRAPPTVVGPRSLLSVVPTARLFGHCSYWTIHKLNILECLENHIN